MAKRVIKGRRVSYASRDAGTFRGALSGWRGRKVYSEQQAENERRNAAGRAADLAANDWVAEALLSTLQYNVIGQGLKPNVTLPAEELNITPEQAKELKRKFEWIYARWEKGADVTGQSSFGRMQFLGLRTLLAEGELIHIPVMLSEAERVKRGLPYSLAVQTISAARLRTPAMYENDPAVRAGIRFDDWGCPVEYYIACPAADGTGAMLTDSDNTGPFVTVPARIGHRPGLLHLFVKKEPEQIRGESVFSNSAALFRYIDDAVKYELEAQNMAAKFAVFIARENSYAPAPGFESAVRGTEEGDEDDGADRYFNMDGPMVMMGRPGEKPEIIKSDRPSANWKELIKLGISGVAGTASLSYLAVSKDYSNVNYSSARAAMNQDWKVVTWHRDFMGAGDSQPFFEMLIEEAYLRGEWAPPAGAPGFYEARDLWTCVQWVGPARGFMDPVKEIQADVLAVQNKLATMHETYAANGRDFDDSYPILLAEHKQMLALGMGADSSSSTDSSTAAGAAGAPYGGPAAPSSSEEDEGENNNDDTRDDDDE